MTTHALRTLAMTTMLTAAASGLPPALLAAQRQPAPRGVQPAEAPAQAAPVRIDDQSARDARQRLREILDQYPPSVSQVLRLDPSLLARPDYIAPYPTLAAFLQAHPEVAHNPGFFFGDVRFDAPQTDKTRAFNMMQDILAGLAALTVFATVIGFLAWLLRAIIDYRYWLRASKTSNEAHNKVFDRLTANEDLLAYIQSPAGQRFLATAPVSIDVTRPVGAPVSRILWSVQAGIVLALGGIGLWVARNFIAFEEIAQLLTVISVLAVALGIGFVLSALVSYALSHRLGLLPPTLRSTSNA